MDEKWEGIFLSNHTFFPRIQTRGIKDNIHFSVYITQFIITFFLEICLCAPYFEKEKKREFHTCGFLPILALRTPPSPARTHPPPPKLPFPEFFVLFDSGHLGLAWIEPWKKITCTELESRRSLDDRIGSSGWVPTLPTWAAFIFFNFSLAHISSLKCSWTLPCRVVCPNFRYMMHDTDEVKPRMPFH